MSRYKGTMDFDWSKIVIGPPAPPGAQTCRVCGCWDYNACVDDFAGPCFWVEGDLCSACATEDQIKAAFTIT